MWLYTLLFGLPIFSFISTVSSDRNETAKLHHSVTLTCDWKCPGSLSWRNVFQKVVSQCDQSSCRSEEGFNISHDQYLKGEPYLTITAADYSNRGTYTCQCEDSEVCDVRLLIQTLEMSRVITPAEPIDVPLPLTDYVEVDFTPSDAEQPSNLPICIVDKDKIHCSPDYKDRASLLSTLQIKHGNFSDSGNYTVRDKVNDKIIVNLQISVEEEKPYPVCNQESSMLVWEGALIAMLVILFILALLVIVYQWREIQKLRKGPADRTQQMTEHTNRHQQNRENERTRSNTGVEISVHTPLTEQQQHCTEFLPSFS